MPAQQTLHHATGHSRAVTILVTRTSRDLMLSASEVTLSKLRKFHCYCNGLKPGFISW